MRLFVCLSVCQCNCKFPSFGPQTKFRLKVLAPVLASDDTILEIFHTNDFPIVLVTNFVLKFFYNKIFLQTFLSHYFHYMYCHYCCRDYNWPCEGPLFHFRVKWSHSLFSLILKQDWMRLSRDVSSNQDRMTQAWPGDYLIKCPALCLLD